MISRGVGYTIRFTFPNDRLSRVFSEEGPSVNEGRFDVTGHRNLDTDWHLGRDLHTVVDVLLNISVSGDAPRAAHLLGHWNLNTELVTQGSYDALNDLICGGGVTVIYNLSVGGWSHNSLDDPFHGNWGNLRDRVGDTGLNSALGMARDQIPDNALGKVRDWVWIVHGAVCVR